jgi:hypothetical protein
MDQAAARGRAAEDQAARKEHHVIECVLCVVLEKRILVVGNLAFRLLLDGDAMVVMRNRSSVFCDVAKDIFFSCWIDDGQSVLIFNGAMLFIGASPLPLALRCAVAGSSSALASGGRTTKSFPATILSAVFRGVLCTLSA